MHFSTSSSLKLTRDHIFDGFRFVDGKIYGSFRGKTLILSSSDKITATGFNPNKM